MHWVSKFIIPVIAGGLGANAMEASVFSLSSSQYEDAGSMTVSEGFARLALKLRLESSVASVLGASETNLERLNQLADGSQLSLFGGNKESIGKTLIVLESFDRDLGISLRQKHTPNIFVPSVSYDLFDDFIFEGRDSKSDHCMYQEETGKSQSEVMKSAKECIARNPVLSVSQDFANHHIIDTIYSVETWTSKNQQTAVSWLKFKSISKDDNPNTKSVEIILKDLSDLSAVNTQQVTVVLLTNTQANSKSPKQLSARNSQFMSSPSGAQSHIQRSAQDAYLHSNLAPVCHASNSSCAESTDKCSGHGSCYLKFGSGVEGTTDNCYACRCDQKWGGPACEKKDISSPFFLLAGVSVFAIFAVGSAVGMLFTMGQQDLPSVIGAGVGGPKGQA